MKKILLVAQREFVATAGTKGFIIGLLIFPALIAVGVFLAPRLMNARSPQVRGDIAVIENLRFNPGETAKDEGERQAFAEQLAGLGDALVSDGFGVVHRKQASVYELARILPSAAGLLIATELDVLGLGAGAAVGVEAVGRAAGNVYRRALGVGADFRSRRPRGRRYGLGDSSHAAAHEAPGTAAPVGPATGMVEVHGGRAGIERRGVRADDPLARQRVDQPLVTQMTAQQPDHRLLEQHRITARFYDGEVVIASRGRCT